MFEQSRGLLKREAYINIEFFRVRGVKIAYTLYLAEFRRIILHSKNEEFNFHIWPSLQVLHFPSLRSKEKSFDKKPSETTLQHLPHLWPEKVFRQTFSIIAFYDTSCEGE